MNAIGKRVGVGLAILLISAGCGRSEPSTEKGSKDINDAPTSQSVPSDWLAYTSPSITFRYPPAWRLKEYSGIVELVKDTRSPSGRTFNVTLISWTLEDTIFCNTVQQCLEENNYLGTATTSTVGGAVAVRGVNNVDNSEPSPQGSVDILLDDFHGYNISYQLHDTAALQELEVVLASIRFVR